MEFGGQQTVNRDASKIVTLVGLLKYGISDNFEARVGFIGGTLGTAPDLPQYVQGPSSPSLGVQWLYGEPGDWGVSKSLQVTHTFGTDRNLAATSVNGIFSSDFSHGFHVDFNVLASWLDNGQGTDRQFAEALSISKNINDKWSCGGEVYTLGPTSLSPRIYSNLYYVAYKVNSRLVLDGGTDIGLNTGSQKYSVFCGLTVGLHRF
jgi:hypothetical protein